MLSRRKFILRSGVLVPAAMPLVASASSEYLQNRRKAFRTPASFTAQTAVFDGTNDYMEKATAPSGIADGKQFTFSCWVRFDGGDGTEQRIFNFLEGGSIRLMFYRYSDNDSGYWLDYNSDKRQRLEASLLLRGHGGHGQEKTVHQQCRRHFSLYRHLHQ